MIGYTLGGMAEGQKTREDLELRRNADARAQEELGLRRNADARSQAEAEQIRRMRDYELSGAERKENLNRLLAGVKEYEDIPEGADPATPRTRRAQRNIYFDQANILQQNGGADGLMKAMEFRKAAYDADKRELDTGVMRIAQSGLSDEEKIQRLAQFTSSFAGLPGKMSVERTSDGKFMVTGETADGKPTSGKVYDNFQQLFEQVQSGASFDNYLRAHELQLRRNVDSRAQALQPSAVRAAEAGATTAEANARIRTGTEAAATAAGNLAPKQIQADIDAKGASTRKDNALADTQPAVAGYYRALADGSITRGGGSGGGAGPRSPGKITVTVDGPEGKKVKKEVSVVRDKDGLVAFIDPATGKPFEDKQALDAAASVELERESIVAAAERDLGSARQLFEKNTNNPNAFAEFEAMRRRIAMERDRKLQLLDFKAATPDERMEQIKKAFDQGRADEDVAGIGATTAEIRAAKAARRAEADERERAEAQRKAEEQAVAFRRIQEGQRRYEQSRQNPPGPGAIPR